MTESFDGLAALSSKRDRKTARRMPPPKNPAPPKPATGPAADHQPIAEESAAAVDEPVAAPAQHQEPSAPQAATPSAVSKLQSTTGRTVAPSTIYFDEAANDWLTEASIAGMRGGTRVDSRSAFARLAMRLLMDKMTPQQAVDLLRAEAASKPSNTPGRPRL